VSFYGYDVTLTPQKSLWKKRYRELFSEVDAVLSEGPHMADAIQRLGCPKQKIYIYHLGVDLDSILFREPNWQTGRPLRILLAAAFTEKKGLPYALAAIAKLRKMRPELNIRVTLIGDSNKRKSKDKEKRSILQAISKGAIADIVTMKGFCSHTELLGLAAEHDIFLSPSVTAKNGDTEGGAPVSIIEMAAAGMIIVSTNHCDIPYVLGVQNSRILADERNSDGLAKTLNWLVKNPDQWTGIAMGNRSRVEREFNLKNQSCALARIYEMIV
jgi:colanic acid/amylovoran biosynthesis glycosyltransferase